MIRCLRRAALFVVLAVMAGCNASSSSTSQSSDDMPKHTVQKFLEAVKAGNQEAAGMMLTAVARKKTAEIDCVVAPPGSETATFKLGQVETVSPTVAHVQSFWTDKEEDGTAHTDEIVWLTRRDPEGWRISGMATRVYDGQVPVMLNFEDPQDMLRRQEAAEKEIARRAQPSTEEKPAAVTR